MIRAWAVQSIRSESTEGVKKAVCEIHHLFTSLEPLLSLPR